MPTSPRGRSKWLTDSTYYLALLAALVVVVVAVVGSDPPAAVGDALSPEWNREFGILEVLQTFLLLGIALILLRDPRPISRIAGLATAVLMLEELDYFLHLWDWVVHGDIWRTDIYGVRNLHNEPWAESFNTVGYLALTSCVLSVAAWRIVRPSTDTRILPLGRPAAAVIAAMSMALVVSTSVHHLYPDAERQFFTETSELALYASAALIVCGIDRRPGDRRSSAEPSDPGPSSPSARRVGMRRSTDPSSAACSAEPPGL